MPAPPPSRSVPGPPIEHVVAGVSAEQVVVRASVELVVARVAEQDVAAGARRDGVVPAAALEAVAEATPGQVVIPRSGQHEVERRCATDVAVAPVAEVGRCASSVAEPAGQVPLSEAAGGADIGEINTVVPGARHRVDFGDLRALDGAGPRVLAIHLDQAGGAGDRDPVGSLAPCDRQQRSADGGAHLRLGHSGRAGEQHRREGGGQGESDQWVRGVRHPASTRNTTEIAK